MSREPRTHSIPRECRVRPFQSDRAKPLLPANLLRAARPVRPVFAIQRADEQMPHLVFPAEVATLRARPATAQHIERPFAPAPQAPATCSAADPAPLPTPVSRLVSAVL